MKRFISALIAFAMILSMVPAVFAEDSTATVLYLQPSSDWLTAGARFAAFFFGNGDTWLDCTDADGDGVYEVTAPEGYPSVIFCRMNPATTENNWSNKWNQTGDLTVPTDDKVCYAVSGWDAGQWTTYSVEDGVGEVDNTVYYYLVGNMNDWAKSDSNLMTSNGDGTYSIVMALDAGEYEYKVTTSTGSWYPDGSNLIVTLESAANVIFTINAETLEITHAIATAEKTTLDLGENKVALADGDFDGSTWTYTATEDGNLTVTVTALAADDGTGILSEVPADYLAVVFARNYTLTIGDTQVYETAYSLNVKAGDVITVTLACGMGTATEATLTLTLGETVEEEEAEVGTQGNPIIIESLPYEYSVDGEHDLYFAYTPYEDVTLLITHPDGAYVSVDNWNDGPVENSKTVEIVAGSTTIINLWSMGAVTGTYTITVYEEVESDSPISGSGTYSDPYVITVPDSYTVDKVGSIYWEYTATESGKLTFTVTCDNWNYFNLKNTVSGVNSGYLYPDDGYSYTIELYKGDTVSGYLYSTSTNGETTTAFNLSFEACPVDKTVSVNASSYYLPLNVVVDADSRVNCQVSFSSTVAQLYVVGSNNNYYVLIGETRYDPDENGKVVLPLESSYNKQTVYLCNTGDEAVTVTYNLQYILGSQQNPDTITGMGDHTANVPEGYAGYNYTWTAPESGKLTFTILDETNWSYAIENVNTGISHYYPAWNSTWTEMLYETTVTLEVNEGDVVTIQVMKEDYTAGEVKFNLSFVAGAVEQFQNMYASEDTMGTSDEVAPGASIRYDVISYLFGGQLTITGTNFYVVVGGTGVYNAELGVFLPEGGTRYDPVDGVVYLNFVDYETTTVHIVNTGSEAATYTFGTNYPTGTEANPDTITDSATITLPESANAYYFNYTATGDGYIIVTITSEGGVYHNVYNTSAYLYAGSAYVADASNGIKVSLPVNTDDKVVISVNTWDVDDSVPGGDIAISVTFVPVPLTGYISCSWSGSIYENETFEIPANSSAVYLLDGFYESCATITGENFYVLVNGDKLEPVNGVVTLPQDTFMVEVVNTSDAVNTFTAGVSYPLGSQKNPEELTMGDHSATVSLYGYYWYTFTATEAGTLKLDMSCNDWYIVDWNTYTGFYSEDNEDPYFEVVAGDELALRVSTLMGNAGTITFTASFTSASQGGDNDSGYLGDGEALILGENHVEVEADSTYGAEWYYVSEGTGYLTISVANLQALVEGEWSALALRALGTGTLGSSVSLYVNDEQVLYDMNTETATLTVEVAAGDVVYFVMSSATGAGLRATLNLAFESNVHDASDGTLILGNNSFTVVTGGSGKWTYTATEDGTLVIELTGASYVTEDLFGDQSTATFGPSELFQLMSGFVLLTVNGEEFVVDEDTYAAYPNLYLATLNVKTGDEVVLEFSNGFWATLDMIVNLSMSEEDAGPEIITELPAELTATFEDDDSAFYPGKSWQYTAAEDGTISFTGLTEGAEIWVCVNDGESLPVDGSIDVKAGDVLLITLYGDEAGTFGCVAMYAEEIVYGDVNDDGSVNYLDAYLVMNYSVGNITEDALDLAAADVNNDGAVNYLDAYLIMNKSVGNIDSFPGKGEN